MKKIIALVLAMCMIVALCASCGSSDSGSTDSGATTAAETETAAEAAESEDAAAASNVPEYLSVGTSETLGQLLPYSSASECGIGLFLVYDMIFYYDSEDQLQSDIITDYYYSDDGMSITLVMRDDIYFSNGDHATSEDLLYSLSSIRDPERAAVSTSMDKFDFDASYCEDDYTVVLCTDGTATAVSQFGNLAVQVLLDKSYCEEVGWESEDWFNGPVGSGPYIVSDYLIDNYYEFTLRDDYWYDGLQDMPQTIKVTAYSEMSTMYMDLENGAISIAVEPESTDYERAIADDTDNIEGAFINGNVCNWIVFDCEGVFSDINIRKAVAHGCNWDEVAASGKGVKFTSATSTIPAYFPDYKYEGQYEYDPEYAAECLAEAGYSVDNPLDIVMYIGPQAGSIATATVMQAQLAEIGINLTFESYEMATVVPMWMAGEGDISTFAMQGGTMALDSYWVYRELCSTATMGDNQTLYDSTIDDLCAAALLATTEEEAREYYYELQDWIYDQYRVVSYFEEVNAVCYDTNVVTSCHFGSKVYPDLRNVTFAE